MSPRRRHNRTILDPIHYWQERPLYSPSFGFLSLRISTRAYLVSFELFKFFARSNPPLQHFTLEGCQIQRERTIQCLHISRHLRCSENWTFIYLKIRDHLVWLGIGGVTQDW